MSDIVHCSLASLQRVRFKNYIGVQWRSEGRQSGGGGNNGVITAKMG